MAFRIEKEQLRRRRHDGISYYVRGQRQESTPSAVPVLPAFATGRAGKDDDRTIVYIFVANRRLVGPLRLNRCDDVPQQMGLPLSNESVLHLQFNRLV